MFLFECLVPLPNNTFGLKDLLYIIFPVLTALLTVYLVNVRLFKVNQKNEIVISFLEQIQNEVLIISQFTREYIEQPSLSSHDILANKIVLEIKQLQMKLNVNNNLMSSLIESKEYGIDVFVKDVREIKQIITNDPFKQANKTYSAKVKNSIYIKLEKLNAKLLSAKLSIYK